jgi:hypothetical protein
MSSRESQTRERAPVAPSSRDGIERWLDVLTSMLKLPPGQRAQVRDELEDHLRSRVDDLLISGTSEPDAIRQAVSELGETAELASLISNARTQSRSRRHLMQFTLAAAAIAGMTFGGVSMISGNGHSTNPNNSMIGSAGVAGVASVTQEDDQEQDQTPHTFDLKQRSLREILTEIGNAFGRSVEYSSGVRRSDIPGMLSICYGNYSGELTFPQAIDRFKAMFGEEKYNYVLTISEDQILFETYGEYQRARIETRVVPSPVWLEDHELFDYANALENLLRVKHDLSMTSIQVVDEAIVVASVPEIQDEIIKLVAELDHFVQQRRDQRSEQLKRDEQERDVRRSESIKKIMIEHERIASDLAKAKADLEANTHSIEVLEQQIREEKTHPNQNIARIDELIGFRTARRTLSERLRYQIAEDEARAKYLLDKMVETEYLYLFDELD